MLWRHPLGCGGTVAAAAGFFVLPMTAQSLGFKLQGNTVLYVWAALLAVVIVVNTVWRSASFAMKLGVCDRCLRARNVWSLTAVAVEASLIVAGFGLLAMDVDYAWLPWLLIPVVYLIAKVLEPWRIRPMRVRGEWVWLRGPSTQVLERYPDFGPDAL